MKFRSANITMKEKRKSDNDHCRSEELFIKSRRTAKIASAAAASAVVAAFTADNTVEALS